MEKAHSVGLKAILVALLGTSVMVVAHAQQTQTTTIDQPVEATATAGTATTQSTLGDSESTATTQSAAMSSSSTTVDSSVGTGVVDSGGGGGGGKLNFQADLFTGRFSYSIPIKVAPARQGAEPKLALGYNSAGGNGWCGVGWALETGYIQRDGRNGVPILMGVTNTLPQYDDAKGFVASIGGSSGNLIRVSSTNQNPVVYRMQVDTSLLTFNYYTNNHWEVADKGGNTFYFGEGATNQMFNPNTNWTQGASSSTFRWALNRVIDVNGNATYLKYTTISNSLYLTNIAYNANINSPALAATHEVNFIPTNRPDTNISFATGYRVQQVRLLSEIQIKMNGQNVRRYVLNYTNSPSTLRSLLTSVTEYGSDFATALPATTFNYQVKPFTFGSQTNWPGVYNVAYVTYLGTNYYVVNNDSAPWASTRAADDQGNTQTMTIDLDGDGLPDRLRSCYGSPYYRFAAELNGNGFFYENRTGGGTNNYGVGSLDSLGQTAENWNCPSSSSVTEGTTLMDMIDINGDGYPDRVMRTNDSPFNSYYVQINTGYVSLTNTFLGGISWTNVDDYESTASKWRSVRYKTFTDLLDMNGDGLPDRVSRKVNSPYNVFKVQLNTGGGFTPAIMWGPLDSQGNNSTDWNSISDKDGGGNYDVVLQDINGDGLPDRVMRQISASSYTNFVVQFNNGAGFEPAEPWGPIDAQGASSNNDWGSPIGTGGFQTWATLVDINGDGLADRVMRKRTSPYTNWVVQINTGSGFSAPANWGPLQSQGNTDDTWNDISYNNSGNDTKVDFFDINGDGLPDRVMRKENSPYTNYVVQLNQGPFPDLLNVVSNGIGGSVQVGYLASTTLNNRDKDWNTDPWKEGAKSLLPFNVWVVSQIAANDGMGTISTNTYAYKGGYNNSTEKEFRGFSQCTVTDPYGVKSITYFHQSGGRDNSALGEYQDQGSESKKGIPFRIESLGADGSTNAITLNKVEESLVNTNGIYFPYISQTIVMNFEGLTNSYRATAKQFFYDTNTENLTKEIDLGEVGSIAANGQTFSDIGSDSLYTWMTYTNLSKPSDIKITSDSAGANRLRETKMTYDSHGNLTGNQVWLDTAGVFITTTTTSYDSYGNPIQATDAAGITTTTTYDSTYKQYPVTQATGTFVNQFAYDYRSGLTVQAIDAKGLVASNAFDALYRSVATYISTTSNGVPNLWKSKTSYTLNGVSGGVSYNYVHKQVNDATDANGFETYTYMDGSGRTIQTRTEAETGQFRVSNAAYDRRGNAYFQTLPYFSSGSNFTSISGTYLGTLTGFDTFGRAYITTPAVQGTFTSGTLTSSNVTNGDTDSPVGPVTTAFLDGTDPWSTVVTDPNSKVKKSYRDAYGRTTKITEVTSGGNYNTLYNYDLLGNLTNVTDNANNKTFMTYDSLARKTGMTDPDMGTWSYAYDNAGRMTQQVDARGNKLTFSYSDQLGRMTSKQIYNTNNQLTGTITYTYDISDDPANFPAYPGQLYKVTDLQGYQRSGYDLRGRVVKTGRFLSVNAVEYVTQTTYDDADRMLTVTYPGNSATIKYTYDTAGNLSQVRSLAGTGTQEIFYTPVAGFNELGQLLSYTNGSGTLTTNSYFAYSKRLQSVLVKAKNGTNLQNLSYRYDAVSNIKKITDGVNTNNTASSASRDNIIYDDLYRVTSLSSVGTSKSFSYDSIGNILVNGDNSSQTYQYASKPHAVTSVGTNSPNAYVYDACGNMITRGSQALTYDEQNQLVSVASTNGTVRFGYDESGERLWRSGTNGYSVWIGGIYEINNGKVLCHVFAGGKRIASFEPQCGSGWAKVFGEERYFLASMKLNSILAWPFQGGRGQWTLFGGTWLGIMAVCLLAGRKVRMKRYEFRKSLRYFMLWKQAVTLLSISAFLWASTGKVEAATFNPVFYYYHNDNLGSSNVLTDRSGAMVQHYEYSTFGQPTFQDNTLSYQVSNRYTGQVLDEETGLNYYGSRYYDANLGRFIQADTIVPSATTSQTLNRYAYCGNNPLIHIDPTGHFFFIPIIIALAYATAAGAAVGACMAAIQHQNIGMGALTGAISGFLVAGFGIAGGAMAGAINAQITGGNVGLGALTGAISASISFGIGALNQSVLNKSLSNFSVSTIGGALGGGVGSVIQGGSFGEGAKYGAIGGAIGDTINNFPIDAWRDTGKTIDEATKGTGDALETARSVGLDGQVNDNKYGHATNMSLLQRAFGPIAVPFLAVGGAAYELYRLFTPGHTQDEVVTASNYGRSGRFCGFFDGQHPANWLWDTPGDMMGNLIGQASGLLFSPSAAAQINKAGFLIPGPNYSGKPESAWTQLAPPGAKWPW